MTENKKMVSFTDIYNGDSEVALGVFNHHIQKTENQNLDEAFQYLVYAANLGHPVALNFIWRIYAGKEVCGIKQKKNLQSAEKYLRMLSCIDRIIDISALKCISIEEVQKYMVDAQSQLGFLYIREESLGHKHMGYIMSLNLALNYNVPLSLYAMGWWYVYAFDDERWTAYTERNYKEAMKWLRSCIDTQDEKYIYEAAEFYNVVAGRWNANHGSNAQVQLYDI